MGTYISQFNLATLLLNTDLVAGLRGTTPNQTDYKFPIIGIGDSLGSPIIAWTQGAGTILSPNINSINFQNNVAGSAPIISTLSSGLTPDTSVNLNIGAFGPLGYVQFTGTNAIAIPAGTAAQAPATFVGGGIRYNTTSQYLDYWSTVSNSWVDLTTGSALSNLTFVTNTNETSIAPNSQALSLLSTGIAYVTTTTGIVGTRTLTGTANEITVSNGTGSVGNPTFSIPSTFIAPGTIAVGNLELTGNTLESTNSNGNINLTPNGSGINVLANAQVTSLTASNVVITDASKNLISAATLSLALGGTNAALTANNGGIFYSTASSAAILAGTATADQLLMSGASGAPSWSTSTYPTTNAVNTLLYASSANVMAALATANNGILVTSSGGVPSISSTLPAAVLNNIHGRLISFQYLTSGTTYTPTSSSINDILVQCLGGGGAGGSATGGLTDGSAGGGGGSGGFAQKWITNIGGSYTATYAIGAAGAIGAIGNNAGGAGGNTTWSDGTYSLIADGGNGGGGYPTLGLATGYDILNGPSTGGGATGGDLNIAGQPSGLAVMGGTNVCTGANGGNSIFGAGGPASIAYNGTAVTGIGASAYGAGGGGGATCNLATNVAGGAGSAGIIVVWEFS